MATAERSKAPSVVEGKPPPEKTRERSGREEAEGCGGRSVRPRAGPLSSKKRRRGKGSSEVEEGEGEEKRERREESGVESVGSGRGDCPPAHSSPARVPRLESPRGASDTLDDIESDVLVGGIEVLDASPESPPEKTVRANPAPEDPGQSAAAAPGEGSLGSGSGSGSGRARGRPPITGKYIGVGKMRELNREKLKVIKDLERRNVELVAQRDLAMLGRSLKKSKGPSSIAEPAARSEREQRALARVQADPWCKSTEELAKSIGCSMGSVEEVARRSGNLKGACVRELKEAAEQTRASAEELRRRVVETGDATGLMAQLADLRLENEGLRQEIAQLRAMVEALKRARATSTPRDLSPIVAGFHITAATNISAAGSGGMEVEALLDPPPLPQRERKRRRDEDASPPPGQFVAPQLPPVKRKAGGGVSRGPTPPPLLEASNSADPFKRIEALLEARLEAFRREILAGKASGPKVTRVEVIAPPGSKRGVVNTSLLKGKVEAAQTAQKPSATASKKKKKKKKKGKEGDGEAKATKAAVPAKPPPPLKALPPGPCRPLLRRGGNMDGGPRTEGEEGGRRCS